MAIKYLDSKRIRGSSNPQSLGSDGDATSVDITAVNTSNEILGTGCFEFERDSSNYCVLPNDLDTILTGAFTFTCWVYVAQADVGGVNETVISKPAAANWSGNLYNSFTITQSGTNFNFSTNNTSTYVTISNAVGGTGWKNLVVTKTSGNLFSFYVNDDTPVTATHASTWGTEPWVIGNTPHADGNRYWDSYIDDMAFLSRVITDDEIEDLYGGGSPSGNAREVLGDTGLVAHYTFDDIALKNSFVADKDTLLIATDGYKAATFDGVNDWALSAGSLGITSGTSYSFGGWFYPQAQPETTGMAMWVGNVLLYRYGGSYVTEGNGTHMTSTTTYADDTWHHIMVNVDSSTATLYIDGANANTSDSDTITGSYTINGIQVAKEGTSTVSEYKGSASDVFVFTRALTAAEIASLSGGAKVSSISQTSIQANYTFDSDFNDSSGNSGRNLTASGNATAGNSVGTSPITTVYSSNLPENTLFEETDTRKVYFLQSAAWLRAKVKATFEEDFDDNSASWSTTGSGASKGLGSHNGTTDPYGGTMIWVECHTGGQNPVYYLDLTSLSAITTVASDWTLRFKYIDIVSNSSNANYGGFGVTAGTSNSLSSEHHVVCSIGGNEMTLSARNNTHIQPTTGNSIENTDGGNEVRYVEIKSDSGTYTLNVYNNSDYTDTPSTMSTTVSLTGLRYLKLDGVGSNSGHYHVGIDDVEFYDGVVL